MSLDIGSQLGIYTVVGLLGKGGMGEVYRATDTKLDREVAIKVLPNAMAYDRERIARFEREAKVLASLNHPMIAAIYGFDEVDGKRFLILELVEGPTLADRLTAGRLPLEESLDIAKQIAEALEVAHEKGIIHRDLKPANVKVTPDGQVKVLDFGLAKAMAEEDTSVDPGASPTITKDFTMPGVILGTAAYMSPEQARGRPVDKRSDIWSFGCVLYECLSGDSMFRGETVTDSIGAILHKQPDWERIPPETPPTVQLVLRRCLAKDRKRRIRDIGDVRIELEAAIADPTSSALGLASAAIAAEGKASTWSLRGIAAIASAMLLTAIVTLGINWSMWPEPTVSAPLRKLPIILDTERVDYQALPVISPDGKKVAYIAEGFLWVRDLDKLGSPRKVLSAQGALFPFWSPLSDHIGFMREAKIWRVPSIGGESAPVAPIAGMPMSADFQQAGATWTTENQIYYALSTSVARDLFRVSANGGEPEIVYPRDENERDVEKPSALPQGRGVIFSVQRISGQKHPADTIAVFSPSGRQTIYQKEGEQFHHPVYSRTGHIVYQRDTTNPGIWAFRFSLENLKRRGEPFKIAEGIMPSITVDGDLLYVTGPPRGEDRRHGLVWIDEQGTIEPIQTREQVIGEFGGRVIADVSLSLDENQNRALVAVNNDSKTSRSIFLYDVVGKSQLQVTFPQDGMLDEAAAWHPDEEHILFTRGQQGNTAKPIIMMTRADGQGEPVELVQGNNFSVSPDGKHMVYDFQTEEGTGRDIGLISLEGEPQTQVLLHKPANEMDPAISPDGRLLAYSSNESAEIQEIYLTRFPSGEGRSVVSANGGVRCYWGKDPTNQVLYYYDNQYRVLSRISVKFDADDTEPKFGAPEPLFDIKELGIPHGSRIDPKKDGKRFIAARLADFDSKGSADESREVILVENWLSEIKGIDGEAER